jgi:hypothetical protein
MSAQQDSAQTTAYTLRRSRKAKCGAIPWAERKDQKGGRQRKHPVARR